MAPSSSNTQPWRFIVINDLNIIKRISDDSKQNLLKAIANDPKSSVKKYASILRKPNYNVFYNAPCLILIVGKNTYDYFYQDCSLATAYFMFAATERNLGTCWIGLGEAFSEASLKKEVGLPDDHQVAAAIILGHPVQIPAIGARNNPIIFKST